MPPQADSRLSEAEPSPNYGDDVQGLLPLPGSWSLLLQQLHRLHSDARGPGPQSHTGARSHGRSRHLRRQPLHALGHAQRQPGRLLVGRKRDRPELLGGRLFW